MATAQLTIKLVSGASESLALSVEDLASTTVLQLKQLVEKQDPQRFPVAAQRLIFQGQILQNDKLLTEYHVASGCALHLTLTPGAARAAAPAPVSVAAAPQAAVNASASAVAQLRAALQAMRHETGYATAVQTLQKICANIISHPSEDKYRKLRLGNAALQSRVFDRSRGMECVRILGFQEGVEQGHLVLVPTAEKWESLVAMKRVMDEALAASSAPAAPSMPAFSSNPMGGFPAGGGDWAAQAQQMLQNPAMAQMLQSNPMMQQMAQMNPMIAQALQNPSQLAQQLQGLQQNPGMMQQISQMMQDPNAMAMMQQQLLGGGGAGFPMGGGASPFGAPSAPSTSSYAAASNPFAAPPAAFSANPTPAPAPSAPAVSPAPQAAAASSTQSTQQTTEDDASFDEEAIADAIARSLQDA